ncbi:MAG: molecular chaperone HtpG [Flavobacteriales bacterium]|nr:molecular chaperone HtpG [Flavobacteriales bacterium]
MAKGKIKVNTENIFPIIKKFLYSDNEIFLRELVSNATDATNKLKTYSSTGELKGDIGDTTIEIEIRKEEKQLIFRDRGIGMTKDEVVKYIADIAFSGAEEFVEKYKDKGDTANIIGHFGLGFFSSFMVAERVEINSKSYKDEPAVLWSRDGSPEFTTSKSDKTERGTEIILHIAEDSTEFLEEARITTLLNKYCKFMPVAIKFGTKQEQKDDPKGKKDKDGNVEKLTVTVDNIINNSEPAWTKSPSKLKDEGYKGFYRELYPMNFQEPLFHIHLNVDYPFNLTGILYFPKLANNIEIQKDKIQLYSNQVFVTDSVEGIVPEFLTLLHGVIDSPDIPLNVSRSYLQTDSNVKKIASHITKKVADKLASLFKKDRKDFESKWDDIKVFIEYGMLSEDKFNEKAEKFALYKSTDGTYSTMEEYKKKLKANQVDKDGNTICLYTNDEQAHHSYIETAKERGYDVLILNSPLTSHFISKIEQSNEKVKFARIDSDTLDKLIPKDEEIPSKLTEKDEEKLKPVIESVVKKEQFMVQFESMNEKEAPVLITEPEFMRRMKEQQAMGGGGMMGMGSMPDMYNLVINSNHPLISKILAEKDETKQKDMTKQATDLALLSQNLLKGEDLTNFIKRSTELIS